MFSATNRTMTLFIDIESSLCHGGISPTAFLNEIVVQVTRTHGDFDHD